MERSQGKGQSFDSSNAAYMRDGNSDLEAVVDWGPVSSHKASGDLELKTPSLKVMNYPSGRICRLQNCSSSFLTTNSSVTPEIPCHRFRFLYCFKYYSMYGQDKAQLYRFRLELKC